jgi:hypothetical protein
MCAEARCLPDRKMLRYVAVVHLVTFTSRERIALESHDTLKDVIMSPFQFINAFAVHRSRPQNPDILNSPEILDVIHWMKNDLGWRPTFTWDPLMFDTFPENIKNEIRPSQPKDDILQQIFKVFKTLKEDIGLPIRLAIGDRTDYYITSTGQPRHLFFTQTKVLLEDDEDKQEAIMDCMARFNLSFVTSFIDELIIEYPFETPGILDRFSHHVSLNDDELRLLQREMVGWRKFWARYAPRLTNLKKLVIIVPQIIFDDWRNSISFQYLMKEDTWDVVNHDGASSRRHSFPCKFVKRTFFRSEATSVRAFDSNGDIDEHLRDVSVMDPTLNESRDLTTDELADSALPSPADRFFDVEPAKEKKKGNNNNNNKRKLDEVSEDSSDSDIGSTVRRRRGKRPRFLGHSHPFFMGHIPRLLDQDSDSDSN